EGVLDPRGPRLANRIEPAEPTDARLCPRHRRTTHCHVDQPARRHRPDHDLWTQVDAHRLATPSRPERSRQCGASFEWAHLSAPHPLEARATAVRICEGCAATSPGT